MSNESLNIAAYLERINYTGKTDVSYETLYGLHTAHTFNVPFENLDVYCEKPILLDQDSLYKKLVENKRGGYCFEMNGFFSIVLKELGFKVTDLLCRGTRDGINYMAKLHQVLMVELDGKKYLVDVGYGNDGLTAPVLIEEGIEQKQFTHTYRLTTHPKYGYILQYKKGDEWQISYAFTLDECVPMDFQLSNHFTSTFPESFFRKMKFCTMPTKEGRITLTDTNFKILENGQLTETAIESEEEFKDKLKEHFGLDLDSIKTH